MKLGMYRVEDSLDEKNITPGVYARVHSSDTNGDFASGLIEYEFVHNGQPCLIKRDPYNPAFWVIRDFNNPEKTPTGCGGSYTDRRRAEMKWKDYVAKTASYDISAIV